MKNPQESEPRRLLKTAALVAVVIGGTVVLHQLLWRRGEEPLVVYCAHDSVYADAVLKDFRRRTQIPLAVKYDTEATKSLGLVELLVREKEHPRCDVFWNNELLGTMDLKDKGVLAPYKGPGYERIPAAFKDPDGCWAGFAARMRVYIVNTEKMDPTEEAVAERLAGDLSRVAIAKPLYGTTLTHYSVLWDLWGEERLKAWHQDCRARGISEVTGNAHVKNLVAEGVCDLGFTDSDDYFVAKDDGKPVAAVPLRVGDGAAICIPNTVAVIRGARHPEEARRLADYLLSADSELALSRCLSRQVPLGPVDERRVPDEVRELQRWAGRAVPLSSLGPARSACLAWLKEEYVR